MRQNPQPSPAEMFRSIQIEAEKQKVKLTPEIKQYISGNLEAIKDKLANKQPIYPRDMEFMQVVREWVAAERIRINLFPILKSRFQSHTERHEGIEWAEVEKALTAKPKALVSLQKMEETGGEPDVLKAEGDTFVFGDCSAESPEGRRNLNYDEALKQSQDFGVEMMTEAFYREIQEKEVFDDHSWSWLATPPDIREAGDALRGDRLGGDVRVYRRDARHRDDDYGFRCALRVQKT